ncbi:uncharacterized protein LOC142238895 isoform X2 [Haematobia irritans]|uniref:uncharacterized protein LOC142238895 isoform X2 n=1 Tax=Haematobia irritans TaxID=7368 RepID=UPI003F4FEED2
MLQLLFWNCCRILWKPLRSHHHHHHHIDYNKLGQKYRRTRLPQQQLMIWVFILFLLSQHQGSYCRPTSLLGNHRAQRRFMWKQMDNAVDGIVGRMVSGARAMKGMIGEFSPHNAKQGYGGNALDYLPTEMTRVKYIIRNPHTKETKVITMRPSKKVVKLMTMAPKSPMSEKPKTKYMLEGGKLRQLEKEQELIAEGKIPTKHEDRPPKAMQMDSYSAAKGKTRDYSTSEYDIVKGTGGLGGNDFGENWKPVYKDPDALSARPSISPLHTSIVEAEDEEEEEGGGEGEEEEKSNDRRKPHMYEVNEYTAEESVMQPLTHEYHSYKIAPLSAFTLKGVSHQHLSESKNEVAHKNLEKISEKGFSTEYRTQKGFVPSRSSYRSSMETTTAASVTTTSEATTTTTEEPNYPASFLKRYREKQKLRSRPKEIELDNSWLPSNASTFSSGSSKPAIYHQTLSSPRTKSQKWPPDVEDTLNPESSQEVAIAAESPNSHLQDYDPHTKTFHNSSTQARKNVRTKNYTDTTDIASSSNASNTNSHKEYNRHRISRHRGSIRFGDKLEV